jgi:hypothetical protein
MLQAEFLRFFGQNSNSGEQFMWNEIAAGWGMQNAEFANMFLQHSSSRELKLSVCNEIAACGEIDNALCKIRKNLCTECKL